MPPRINLENSFSDFTVPTQVPPKIEDPLRNKKYDFLVDPLREPNRKKYDLVHPYDLRAKVRPIHEPSIDLTDQN